MTTISQTPKSPNIQDLMKLRKNLVSADSFYCLRECLQTFCAVCGGVCRHFGLSADSLRCLRGCLQTVCAVCETVCRHYDDTSRRQSADTVPTISQTLETINAYMGRRFSFVCIQRGNGRVPQRATRSPGESFGIQSENSRTGLQNIQNTF